MQSFQIIASSWFHYLLILFAGFIVVIPGIAVFPETQNKYIYIIGGIIGLSFLVFWLAKKYSQQIVCLTINPAELVVEWIQLPPFSKRQNIQIAWSDIDNYIYQVERNLDLFKITFTNGKKFKLSISHEYDDQVIFDEFYRSFLTKIDNLRAPQSNERILYIKQGKTFYEKPLGIGLAFLSAGLLLFVFTYVLISDDTKANKWTMFLASTAICLYCIPQVWQHYKRKKSSN